MSVPPAIELRGICKSFGAVAANRDIDLTVAAGSIHGIVGENGAGKSTLMSILAGYYQADAGEIRIDGDAVRIRSGEDALRQGIGMVHQHFMLVDDFTVLENLVLGCEGGPLLADALATARARLAEIARDYGFSVDPDALVGRLGVGLRQRVEILKALYRGARILVLDEPTAVLTPQEADQLFQLLRAFRAEGRTVILITHKLREVMAVTDRVSVMRAGRMVATVATAETDEATLAELMVGHRIDRQESAARVADASVPVLAVRDLTVRDSGGLVRVAGASFTVAAGEIVGVAGVAGNGQSELLEALGGLCPASGEIRLNGRLLETDGRSKRPSELRAAQVGHVPEDRQRTGLIAAFDLANNGVLGYQRAPEFNWGPLLVRTAIERTARRLIEAFDVRPPDPSLRTGLLSGGNQQKVVLAREIDRAPSLLLVGQPTRGVDIGAIEIIHRRLLELRAAGCAILLVSVELDEILHLSDRILVMAGGRIVGDLPRAQADERRLGLLMAGVDTPQAA